MSRIVILSPHFDDAALSCGGWAASNVEPERASVITIFGGVPDYSEVKNLPLAAKLHAEMGSSDDPVGRRRQEDASSLAILGIPGSFLEYHSADYRRNSDGTPSYLDWTQVQNNLVLSDQQLANQLCDELLARFPTPNEIEFWVPFGIGGHVDHRIVRDTGLLLLGLGYAVAFFEDLPYVSSRGVPKAILDSSAWTPEHHFFDQAALAKKAEAVYAYTSQLPSLVYGLYHGPPVDSAEGRLRQLVEGLGRYALTASNRSEYAERVWRLRRRPAGPRS
jgi:LmbE family N-acetylglucosaminyl deacetylase